MKKLLSILGAVAIVSSSASSIVACDTGTANKHESEDQKLLKNIVTTLQPFSDQSKPLVGSEGVDQASVLDSVKNALKDVPGFIEKENFITIRVTQLSPISYDTGKMAPASFNVTIDPFGDVKNTTNQNIFYATPFFNKLNAFELKTYDDDNYGTLQMSNLKIRALFGEQVYDLLSKDGQKWMDETSFNDFLKTYLDPSNGTFAKMIPSTIGPRNADGSLPTDEGTYGAYVDAVLADVAEKSDFTGFGTHVFNLTFSPLDSDYAKVQFISNFTLKSMLIALAPDIIHFHNFIINHLEQESPLVTGNFFGLLVQYLSENIGDYSVGDTPDGFSNVDATDKGECHLKTNFDVLIYDLFNVWYLGQKSKDATPYALQSGGKTGLDMQRMDGQQLSDKGDLDLRGVQQSLDASALVAHEVFHLGYTALNLAFAQGYTEGIFKGVISQILSNDYTPQSKVNIEMHIGFDQYNLKYDLPVPFAPVHEAELNQFSESEDVLNLPSGTVNTTLGNGGSFELYYKVSGQQDPIKATGLTADQFLSDINGKNISGFEFRMQNLDVKQTIVVPGDGPTINIEKEGLYFRLEI